MVFNIWQVFNTLCFIGSHETGIWCCLWHMELGSSPLHNAGRVRIFLSCFVYLESQNVACILASIEMVRCWLVEWHTLTGGPGSSESKPNQPRSAHKQHQGFSSHSAGLGGVKDFPQFSGGNWVCENMWWVSFYLQPLVLPPHPLSSPRVSCPCCVPVYNTLGCDLWSFLNIPTWGSSRKHLVAKWEMCAESCSNRRRAGF